MENNQTSLEIPVYEGERPQTKHNHLLGEFELNGIPPAPKGVPKILVNFDLDANGILKVTATDTATGNAANITIHHNSGQLSDVDRQVSFLFSEDVFITHFSIPTHLKTENDFRSTSMERT